MVPTRRACCRATCQRRPHATCVTGSASAPSTLRTCSRPSPRRSSPCLPTLPSAASRPRPCLPTRRSSLLSTWSPPSKKPNTISKKLHHLLRPRLRNVLPRRWHKSSRPPRRQSPKLPKSLLPRQLLLLLQLPQHHNKNQKPNNKHHHRQNLNLLQRLSSPRPQLLLLRHHPLLLLRKSLRPLSKRRIRWRSFSLRATRQSPSRRRLLRKRPPRQKRCYLPWWSRVKPRPSLRSNSRTPK